MKDLISNVLATLVMLAIFTTAVWPAAILLSFAMTGEWLWWQALALAGAVSWMMTMYSWGARIGSAWKSLDGE